MSRKPGHPLPLFFWGDNAGRSSQAWPRLLSVGDEHMEKICKCRNNLIESKFNCIRMVKKILINEIQTAVKKIILVAKKFNITSVTLNNILFLPSL